MHTRLLPVLLAVLSTLLDGTAQTSFYLDLPALEVWPNARTAALDDGFILANDLSAPGSMTGTHGFMIARFDSCAQQAWAFTYELGGAALFLTAVAGLPDGRLVAAGQTGNQDVFLLHLSADGQPEQLRVFDASEVDRCAALAVSADGIYLLNRLLSEAGSRDWVMALDHNGTVRWSSIYGQAGGTAAAAAGPAGVFCRSGTRFFMLDRNGELRWSQELLDGGPLVARSSEAVAINGGFAVAVQPRFNADYQLLRWSDGGQLQPYSTILSSRGLPALAAVEEGGLSVITVAATDQLHVHTWDAGGNWLETRPITADGHGEMRQVAAASGQRGHLLLAGTGSANNDHTGFFTLLTPGTDWSCAAGVPLEKPVTADAPDVHDAELTRQAQPVQATDSLTVMATSMQLTLEQRCELERDTAQLRIDTTIVCTDQWVFGSPLGQATYRWPDGGAEAERTLQAPGRYEVEASTCRTTYDISIDLRIGNCPCEWFVPNAFSPNGDATNDDWQPFPNCEYRTYSLHIFDRWGSLLFKSEDPGTPWNGHVGNRPLPSGAYMYSIEYDYEIQPGRWRKMQRSGTVSIVR